MSTRPGLAPRALAVAALTVVSWLPPQVTLAAGPWWTPASVGWAQAGQAGDVLAEIRIHGNYSTPDADVIQIAQLAVGQPVTASTIEDARARLEASGRFLAVEIRKRYRSLDATAQVAVVIIVQEHPVPEDTPALLKPFRRTLGSGMFLPILRFEDGYGFTYGARVSFVDGLGRGARVSVPLTWGGAKAATVEFEKDVSVTPFDRLTASASISRRTNPHFDIDDDRREVSVGASRQIGKVVRAGVHAGLSHIGFGAQEDRMTWYGADVTVDTRQDPAFPRNAIHAVAGVERVSFRSGLDVNRYRVDARGYVGLIGQAVLSIRGQFATAGGPLPDYERFLSGGSATLRGHRTGAFVGDTLAAGSLEVRVPLGSALSVAHYGVTAFADAGMVADHGTRLADAKAKSGFGGGVFVLASVFHLKIDVGVRGEGGVRVHLTSGFQF
jgi:outer membrane protein assembly factor BamA